MGGLAGTGTTESSYEPKSRFHSSGTVTLLQDMDGENTFTKGLACEAQHGRT